MKIIAPCLVLVASCMTTAPTTTPVLDPTGHWDMSIAWDNGTCDPSLLATLPAEIDLEIFTQAGLLIPSTTKENTPVIGHLGATDTDATVDVTVSDNTMSRAFSIHAELDDAHAIVGFGVATLFGASMCQETYNLSGQQISF